MTNVKQGQHITVEIGKDDTTARVSHVESEYKFAFELRNSARFMANSANEIGDSPETYWQLKSFIFGAIILSYASLEAALNEIIHLRAFTQDSPLSTEEQKVIHTIGTEGLQSPRESNTLQQYNLLLRIMGKQEFKIGEAPYQPANLVRKLRNMLVHPKPVRVVTFTEKEDYDYSSQQDIVKQLRSHLGLSKDSTFPTDILNTKCASWAVKSCDEFLNNFVTISGINIGFITDK